MSDYTPLPGAGGGADPRVDEIIADVVVPFVGEPAVADTLSQLVGNTAVVDPAAMIGFNFSYGAEIAPPHIIDADAERDAAGLVELMNAHIQESYPQALRGIVVSQVAGVLSVTAAGILPLKIFHGWEELGFAEGQANTGIAGAPGTGSMDRLSVAESGIADSTRQLNAARRLPGNATAEWYPTSDFTYDFTNGGLFDGALAFNISLYGLSNTLIEITYADALAGAVDPAAVTAFELMDLLNDAFGAAGVDAYMGLESQGAVWMFRTYSGLGGSGAEMQITALAEDLGGTSPGIGGADGYHVGADSAEVGTRLDAIEADVGVKPVFTKYVLGTAADLSPAGGDDLTADPDLSIYAGQEIALNADLDGMGVMLSYSFSGGASGQAVAMMADLSNEGFTVTLTPFGLSIARPDGYNFNVTFSTTDLGLAMGHGAVTETSSGNGVPPQTLQMTTRQAIQYLLNNS